MSVRDVIKADLYDLFFDRYTGHRDKEGNRIVHIVRGLAEVSGELKAMARAMIRTYGEVAHTMVKRLHTIARSDSGGTLFSTQDTDFTGLEAEIKRKSGTIKRLVGRIQTHVRVLTEALYDKKLKYAERKKLWGLVSKAFEAASMTLESVGFASNIFFPLGSIASAALGVSSLSCKVTGTFFEKLGKGKKFLEIRNFPHQRFYGLVDRV
jgi:hypothetical protein